MKDDPRKAAIDALEYLNSRIHSQGDPHARVHSANVAIHHALKAPEVSLVEARRLAYRAWDRFKHVRYADRSTAEKGRFIDGYLFALKENGFIAAAPNPEGDQ